MFKTIHSNKLWKFIPGINKCVNLMHTAKSTNGIQMRLLNGNSRRFAFSGGKNLPQDQKETKQKQSNSRLFMNKQQMFKKQQQQAMKIDPLDDPSSYDKSSSNAGIYVMLAGTVLLFLIYKMNQNQSTRANQKEKTSVSGLKKLSSTQKSSIGGEWTLTDTNGRLFSSRDLQGYYYLIYFGFTNCPDICPNSLMKLAKAVEKIKKMPQGQYFKLRTVFVSVDPDRDDAKKIRKFLDYFDKDIIGVTGKSNDDPDLQEVMKKFKIYASKIEFDNPQKVQKGRKSYTIDHTTLAYLMDDNNDYLTHLGPNLGENDLAKKIMNVVLRNQQGSIKKRKG